MIRIRKAGDRGHAQYDWLDTWHTFSFDTYHDPAHMGFRSLRVMNEDRVQPGQGFGMHGHRDMEIVTYVLEGALEHRDNMGNGSIIHAGEFQRMSAGTGIQHGEFNPSDTESVHLYQIWLLPATKGLKPSYEERTFSEEEKQGKLLLVASPEDDGSLMIHQDARIYLSTLQVEQEVRHELQAGRHAWVQVLRGSVEINGQRLVTSDGAAVSDESGVTLHATEPAEVMLFDLA
jgi:redox-sensitive bicupin YhaK (pirin superfamily)